MVEGCNNSVNKNSLEYYLRSTPNRGRKCETKKNKSKVVQFSVRTSSSGARAPQRGTVPPIGIFALGGCGANKPVENSDASVAGEAGKQDVEGDKTVAKPDAIAPKLDTVPPGPRYNSFLKGNWNGINGFDVSAENGALHATGTGKWPGLNILAAAPGVDISHYKTIQFKIRGNVFEDKSKKVIKEIKVEVYDDNPQKAGALKAWNFFPITYSAYTTVSLDLGKPNKANTLRQFQIMLKSEVNGVNVDVSGWFSIEDVYIK